MGESFTCFDRWVVCSGCGCVRGRGADLVEVGDDPSSSVGVDVSAMVHREVVVDRLLPSDPSNVVMPHWQTTSDVVEFAGWADVVFIGRLIEVASSVGLDPVDPSGPEAEDLPTYYYDGLVFEIDEVLKSTMGNQPGDIVTVGHPTQYEIPATLVRDSDEVHSLRLEPIDALEHGLRQLEAGEAPVSYIVMVRALHYRDGSAGFVFMGPGSVAQIEADGRTIVESGGPFLNLHPDRSGLEYLIDLDVIRHWLQTGERPLAEIPESAWPTDQDMPDQLSPERVVQD